MKKKGLPKTCWTDEYLEGVRYGLEGELLIDEKSQYQRIQIIDSKRYGISLLLDGCWMTAEGQEKYYHECLVHPALSSAKEIKSILIVGGGDGGTARECLKYTDVQNLDIVEIDERVVKLSQKYMPSIWGGAWKDSRVKLHIGDGVKWVKNSQEEAYDVIIVDGSDPVGPAKGLFNKSFFENCRRILKPSGIFATQSESPEAFSQIHIDTVKLIRAVFKYADPLYGWVPMYPSGIWSWTFAAKDKKRYLKPNATRADSISPNVEIWSTRWQKGAFEAIPAFIERKLKE